MQGSIMLGMSLLVWATGCVAASDLTSTTLPRRSDNRYTFAVSVESFGTTVSSVSAAIGTRTFPMRSARSAPADWTRCSRDPTSRA